MEAVEKIQRRTLRLCIGLRKSTPTNVVLAEVGIGLVRHKFMFLISKLFLRSFAFTDSVLIDKLYDLQVALLTNGRNYSTSSYCTTYSVQSKNSNTKSLPLQIFRSIYSPLKPLPSFLVPYTPPPPSVVEDI